MSYAFRYQIPDNWPYKEARQLFKEPVVLTDEEQLDLKWAAPDEQVISVLFKLNIIAFQHPSICMYMYLSMYVTSLHYFTFIQGLITFLVNENGFNNDRVTKVCSLMIIIVDFLSWIYIIATSEYL